MLGLERVIQEPVVHKTTLEKWRYFKAKSEESPGNAIYLRSLIETTKEIIQKGITGLSGTHYMNGDEVKEGPLLLLGEEKPVLEGYATVFRVKTLSCYQRDGLPVEMVDRSEVKSL